MLWYDMYMMKFYVENMERYVMFRKLYVYKWHEITINDMKYNPIRIMYDMWTEKWEMIWYERKMIAGLYFHHKGTNAYTTRLENYHYVLHNAIVTITNSNGCPA